MTADRPAGLPERIRPPRLRPGDTLGIVSPSASVRGERDRVERGLEVLASLGFRPRLGRHAWDEWHGLAGRHEDRAADLNRMFADPEVAGIIATEGGSGCLPIVDALDYAAIRRSPKVFCGISDLTILLNAITFRTGVVTFHGPDVAWGFGSPNPGEVSLEVAAFRAVTMAAEPAGLLPTWSGPPRVLRPGEGRGPLAGGNLTCLGHLAGTPYFPDLAGAALVLEGYGLKTAAVRRWLHTLRLGGHLARLAGLALGTWDACFEGEADPQATLTDLVLETTRGTEYPIIQVGEVGHNTANVTLPLGCRARISEAGIALEEPAVS